MTRLHTFCCFVFAGLEIASSGARAAVPSHCKSDEYPILDAWMSEIHATPGGWRNKKEGKVVSICANSKAQPFERVAYRYGMPGRIEMDETATKQSKFGVASISTTPHTGDDLVFFKKGDYTYYVAIATAQGHGVSMYVFKGQKKIAYHFSGNEEGEDYQLGPAEIFPLKKHAVSALVYREPEHDIQN